MPGLWIPDTLSSPRADVVTTSVAGFPSEPGAQRATAESPPACRPRGETSSIRMTSTLLAAYATLPARPWRRDSTVGMLRRGAKEVGIAPTRTDDGNLRPGTERARQRQ